MSCQIDIDFVPRVPRVPPVPPFLDNPYIQNTHTIEAIIYIFLSRMGVENNREQGEQRERQSKKPYISTVCGIPAFQIVVGTIGNK